MGGGGRARWAIGLALAAGLALLGAWWLGRSRPTRVDLFDGPEVVELSLRLAPEASASLRRRPRKWVPATLDHGGQSHEVRVRIKGHRSRRDLDDKPALSIRLSGEARAHFGRRRLTLNNMAEDPSQSREVLSYELYRGLGLMAPRTAYARLEIDGEPRGAYLLVEAVDEDWAKRVTGRSGSLIYEGEYGCDLFVDDVDGFDLDAGEDPDRRALRELSRVASGPARELFDAERGPFDVPAVLRFLAANAVLGDFDGYRHSHNYFLHRHPESLRWQLVPWGQDRTFKRRLGIYDSHGWLAKRCFADPSCRLRYVRELSRVVEVFESLELGRRARHLHALVDSIVDGRAASPHSKKRVDRARIKLLDFVGERPAQVRAELSCLDADGQEVDRDGDGFGCSDCDDGDASVHPGAAEACDGVDRDCSGLADDDPSCPCNAVSIGDAPFELCNLPMAWQAARDHCDEKGMVLATIESPEQSRKLYRATREISDQRWWIGYHDREVEGRFEWLSKASASEPFWVRGQPDNGSCNQDCVALKEDAGGRWHDTHCNQHRPFICGPRR